MFFKIIDFSKYSSIKVGQPAKVLMIEKDDEIPTDRYLVGGANNLLVSPTPPPLMMLSKDFATIEQKNDMLSSVLQCLPVASFLMRRNMIFLALSFALNFQVHWVGC